MLMVWWDRNAEWGGCGGGKKPIFNRQPRHNQNYTILNVDHSAVLIYIQELPVISVSLTSGSQQKLSI